MAQKLTPDEIQIVCDLYQKVQNISRVQKETGFSTITIRKYLKKNNIPFKYYPPSVKKVDREAVINLLNEHKSATQISRELGVTRQALEQHMSRHKIPYWKNENAEKIIDMHKSGKSIWEISELLGCPAQKVFYRINKFMKANKDASRV